MAGTRLSVYVLILITLPSTATARASEEFQFPVAGFGDHAFKAVLDLPKGRTRPAPVVILLPGSDGVDQRQDFHRHALLAAGIGTLVVDIKSGTFTSRRDRPPAARFQPVAFEALRLLRQRRDVDAAKIAVMGWSFGATISVGLAHVGRAPGWLDGNPGFAAHVGFYGGCTSRRSVVLHDVPVLVVIGSADTHTDPGRCTTFERLFSNVSAVIYPGIHHGFDKEGVDRARNGRVMRWNGDAAVDARARVVKFFVDALRPGG